MDKEGYCHSKIEETLDLANHGILSLGTEMRLR